MECCFGRLEDQVRTASVFFEWLGKSRHIARGGLLSVSYKSAFLTCCLASCRMVMYSHVLVCNVTWPCKARTCKIEALASARSCSLQF